MMALVLVVCLSGCSSNYQSSNFKVFIDDPNTVLQDSTLKWLESYSPPPGVAVAVAARNTLPEREIGAVADDIFSEMAKIHPSSKAFKERGVLLVVSKKPEIIQVRTGKIFHPLARWNGITAGSHYLSRQKYSADSETDKVRGMVAWSVSQLPSSIDIPWYKRFLLNDITHSLSSELDNLSTPSETFYGNYLLRPFLYLRCLELSWLGTWWITYVIAFLIYKLISQVVTPLFGIVLRPILRDTAWKIIVGIIPFASVIVLAFPSATSAIILSGSRYEDLIPLEALGWDQYLKHISFAPELFNQPTGFWLALGILLLRLIFAIVEGQSIMPLSSLPDDKQRLHFEAVKKKNPVAAFYIEAIASQSSFFTTTDERNVAEAPYSHALGGQVGMGLKASIRWGLLAWLFLPKSLSLAALYWLLPSILLSLLSLPSTIAGVREVSKLPPHKN
jgi:hypothetical protein